MWSNLDGKDTCGTVWSDDGSNCDNQSCINLYENMVFHDWSKHIDIQYHHLQDCVQRWIMLLQYILTEEQDVDILTKDLSRGKSEFHKCRIGWLIIHLFLRGSVDKCNKKVWIWLCLVQIEKILIYTSTYNFDAVNLCDMALVTQLAQ